MRGTLYCHQLLVIMDRFIPAYAGNTQFLNPRHVN